MIDTLDSGHRGPKTRRIGEVGFETLDVETGEKREVARAPNEGADLVARFAEKTRQVAPCEPVSASNENFQSSLLPAL